MKYCPTCGFYPCLCPHPPNTILRVSTMPLPLNASKQVGKHIGGNQNQSTARVRSRLIMLTMLFANSSAMSLLAGTRG